MIRQSFGPALSGARPDLVRVAQGIAGTLRSFSTAQRLAANEDSDNRDGFAPAPSSKERAAAAYSDLVNMTGEGPLKLQGNQPTGAPSRGGLGFRSFDRAEEGNAGGNMSRKFVVNRREGAAPIEAAPLKSNMAFRNYDRAPQGNAIRENPSRDNVLRDNAIQPAPSAPTESGDMNRPDPERSSAPFDNNFSFRKFGTSPRGPRQTSSPSGNKFDFKKLNFRNEGAANGDEGSAPFRRPAPIRSIDLRSEDGAIPPRGEFTPRPIDLRSEGASPAPGQVLRAPAVFRGGFRGRGGMVRTSARPIGQRPSRGKGKKRQNREKKTEENDAANSNEDYPPIVKEMREETLMGTMELFDPSIEKKDLVGWGPAMASGSSSFAKESVVVRQARMLGGAQPFHPVNVASRNDMWEQYKNKGGLFFGTEETKEYVASVMGVEKFPEVPKETKDAVLEASLLGTYPKPQFVELGNTVDAVRNYITKNNSWNAEAERRIQAKIASLLPKDAKAPGAARPAAKRA